MSRIYIFTGKGGVGKSSVAAATAIKSAKEGKKTLLVSTDMAHNIGDIFEVTLGMEPMEVAPHLDAYEIDPNYVCEHDFSDITECMERMIPHNDQENSMEDFGIIPGMEELFSLLKISDIYEKGVYERIIVDCAPTGETLSLLKFPELLSWYMEKFFPIGKVAMRMLSPVSKQLFKVELPNKVAMNDIERIYLKLNKLQDLLKDREKTSVRVVTTPEKMVVEETKRNYMYMNLYNFNVDGIYINRILPAEVDNPFFDEWKRIQKKYISELEETFKMLPIYYIPWYDEELKGKNAVERICTDAFSNHDIFTPKIITERETYQKNETGYLLSVSIPNASKEDLRLYQTNTDIVIRLCNFKRNIPLPNTLKTYHITSGKLEDGILHIQFQKGGE